MFPAQSLSRLRACSPAQSTFPGSEPFPAQSMFPGGIESRLSAHTMRSIKIPAYRRGR
jgi:hypothetical protein